MEYYAKMCVLSKKIGKRIDIRLLREATQKPDYERLESLGDTYLKLETSWYMYEEKKEIMLEGILTMMRGDIIRNDRLQSFSEMLELHHFICNISFMQQNPLRCWRPPFKGTAASYAVHSKLVADVFESICGAYLVGCGEIGARHFLRWAGVPVLPDKAEFLPKTPYYPNCIPTKTITMRISDTRSPKTSTRSQEISTQLKSLQEKLGYTFRDPRLLLEAVTHPSFTCQRCDEKDIWKDYQRLEYFGDALIEYLVMTYSFQSNPHWPPANLSYFKHMTVSNNSLGRTAVLAYGVQYAVVHMMMTFNEISDALVGFLKSMLGKMSNEQQSVTWNCPKMFADVFESLVAAVFIDSGNDFCVIREVFLAPLLGTVGEQAKRMVLRKRGIHEETGC